MEDTMLEDRIARGIAARADALGLDADRLRVTYVLNWGGFVNRSYHVTDGRRRYHLKLSDAAETLPGLQRWRGVHELLTARYHAPEMVDWIALPDLGLEGPLFRHVDGAVPEVRSPELLAAVAPVIERLHGDGELAAHIASDEAPRPCRDTFLETYAGRFREDLAFVSAHRPGFVSPGTLAYIRGQADALEVEVHAHPAFAEPGTSPIHADLWLENLLLDGDGRWWVLDWDGLTVGDPAIDWAMLLGPTTRDLAPLDISTLPPDVATDAGLRSRLPIYARASLLDWALDPLADWIDADAVPEHTAAVRAEKERQHLAALALYRATY
ncbi:MAG TPA: aminoglycoside phosphotransferase family protein [Longimicrobium sp.]